MKPLFLVIILLTLSSPLGAVGPLDLYEYDSSLAWGRRVELTVEGILKRLTRFLRPVEGVITSTFGPRRHPLLGMVRHHRGIDIACAEGSEIRAVLPAVVKAAGWFGGYGKMVILQHPGKFSETRYAHLSKVLVGKGETVVRGQLIGRSGMTGLVTGPHLHFEVYRDGTPVDPEKLLQAVPNG